MKKKQESRHQPLNHLPLTVETLRAAYDYLRATPPFDSWNLPDSEDIKFRVAKDRQNAAWHVCWGRGRNRKHVIAVSVRHVGRTESLISAMCHEAIHLHMAITGMDRGAGEHGEVFNKIAGEVCRIHGFDPKAF